MINRLSPFEGHHSIVEKRLQPGIDIYFLVPKEYMLINRKKRFNFSIVIHYDDNSDDTTAKKLTMSIN